MYISDTDYYKLRLYVIKHATLHGFKVQDCDDIFHDALLHILENNTQAIYYYKILWKYIGKHRERRHREGKRQVEYDDNKDRT